MQSSTRRKRPYHRGKPLAVPPVASFDVPPPELRGDREASREWRRLAPILRITRQITEADRPVLIAACAQWSLYLRATKAARGRLTIKTGQGYDRAHPAIAIAQKAAVLCLKLWAKLGVTARSRFAPGDDPAVPGDPFAAEFDRSTH